MAKASKKRTKKKSTKRKSPAKKASRKKVSARRKSSSKKTMSRKSTKRKLAKKKPAKRRSAKRKQVKQEPTTNGNGPVPVLFAVVLAFLVGLAVLWHFTDFSMAANAAANPVISSMVGLPFPTGAIDIGCETVRVADTWLTLMHTDLAPGMN